MHQQIPLGERSCALDRFSSTLVSLGSASRETILKWLIQASLHGSLQSLQVSDLLHSLAPSEAISLDLFLLPSLPTSTSIDLQASTRKALRVRFTSSRTKIFRLNLIYWSQTPYHFKVMQRRTSIVINLWPLDHTCTMITRRPALRPPRLKHSIWWIYASYLSQCQSTLRSNKFPVRAEHAAKYQLCIRIW